MLEEERIKEILIVHLGIDESILSRDLSFKSLSVDSLQLLELVVAIEKEFDISLDDEKLANMENLGQIANFILEEIKE